MFGSDFDHLRIDNAILSNNQHPMEYIKEGDGPTAIRRIYGDVQYDEFEQLSIQQLKELLLKKNALNNQQPVSDQKMLRFLYASKFILNQTFDILKTHIKWLASDPVQLSESLKEYLKTGVIYLGGRDKMLRPTIIINATRIDLSAFDYDEFLSGLRVVLTIAEDYMFFSGKIEKWNIIIDVDQINDEEFPIHTIHKLILCLQLNFPECLEQMYIIDPSQISKPSWDMVSQFIDPKCLQRIQILSEFDPEQNGYYDSQVEERYNGSMKNIDQFSTTVNTINQTDIDKFLIYQKHQNSQNALQLNQTRSKSRLQSTNYQKKQLCNTKIGVHMYSTNAFLSDANHDECPFCVDVFQVLKPTFDYGPHEINYMNSISSNNCDTIQYKQEQLEKSIYDQQKIFEQNQLNQQTEYNNFLNNNFKNSITIEEKNSQNSPPRQFPYRQTMSGQIPGSTQKKPWFLSDQIIEPQFGTILGESPRPNIQEQQEKTENKDQDYNACAIQ